MVNVFLNLMTLLERQAVNLLKLFWVHWKGMVLTQQIDVVKAVIMVQICQGKWREFKHTYCKIIHWPHTHLVHPILLILWVYMHLIRAQKYQPFLAVWIVFTICSVPAQSDRPFSRKDWLLSSAFQTHDGVCLLLRSDQCQLIYRLSSRP